MPRALSVWSLCDARAGNISGRQRQSILSAKHCDTSYVGTMKPPPLALHHGVDARDLPGDDVHIAVPARTAPVGPGAGEEKPAACSSDLDAYQLACEPSNSSPVQHSKSEYDALGEVFKG